MHFAQRFAEVAENVRNVIKLKLRIFYWTRTPNVDDADCGEPLKTRYNKNWELMTAGYGHYQRTYLLRNRIRIINRHVMLDQIFDCCVHSISDTKSCIIVIINMVMAKMKSKQTGVIEKTCAFRVNENCNGKQKKEGESKLSLGFLSPSHIFITMF